MQAEEAMRSSAFPWTGVFSERAYLSTGKVWCATAQRRADEIQKGMYNIVAWRGGGSGVDENGRVPTLAS